MSLTVVRACSEHATAVALFVSSTTPAVAQAARRSVRIRHTGSCDDPSLTTESCQRARTLLPQCRTAAERTLSRPGILRHLHAVITTGRAWDPDIATHGTHRNNIPWAA